MAKENVWHGGPERLPEFELATEDTALLIIDMQYLDAHRDYGLGAEAKARGVTEEYEYYFSRVENVLIPNIQRLQGMCRERGIEVMHVRIASLVEDCRDVAEIHKRLKLFAPAGSKEAEILEEIKPLDNEVVISKGCSGAFNGTNLDQILANMGIKNLICTGVVTNGCVETTVRSAGDRDYNVILVGDCCATHTQEEDEFALKVMHDSYCKVKNTEEVAGIIEKLAPRRVGAGT